MTPPAIPSAPRRSGANFAVMRHFLASLTLFPQIFCFAKSLREPYPMSLPGVPKKRRSIFLGWGWGRASTFLLCKIPHDRRLLEGAVMSFDAGVGGMTEGVKNRAPAQMRSNCVGRGKRRRGSGRGGAFTKNGEGGRAYTLPKLRLGDGRPLPQIPMQAALRRGVIFSSMILRRGRKINLLFLFFALLPHLGAVECAFHALLTVERLTFPAFLLIIEAWKKIRTALPRSSAKTS